MGRDIGVFKPNRNQPGRAAGSTFTSFCGADSNSPATGLADCSADCRCIGICSRARGHPPRSETCQYQVEARRYSEDPRLRVGEGAARRRQIAGYIQLAHVSLAATQAGIILGTAGYMSPAQAKGKEVDRRVDIWAFGVVLFEMLTGKILFSGETVSETMAFVMTKEPVWDALPKNTPLRLRESLRRCLVKDPRSRLRDIGEARLTIEDIIAHPEAEPAKTEVAASPQRRTREYFPWTLAAVLTMIAAVLAFIHFGQAPPAGIVTRFPLLLPECRALTQTGIPSLDISPDGTRLVYAANRQLYVRSIGDMDSRPLPGTDVSAMSPVFSPDSQWVGF